MFTVRMLIAVSVTLIAFGAFVLLAPHIPASSSIKDAGGDAVAIRTRGTYEAPLVQPYHDITSASIQRMNGNELLLTMELDGNPNLNTTYETAYIWIIEYPTLTGTQRYTIIVPHFPPEFGLSIGWHIAILDDKARRSVIPLTIIDQMPRDRVEVKIDQRLIGNPSIFWWQAFVMVRTDKQFSIPPDFWMDSAPNGPMALFPFT